MGAVFCCVIAADGSDADWVNISTNDTFVGTGEKSTYTISGDRAYYYKAEIQTGAGDKAPTGSVSSASGTLTSVGSSGYSRSVTLTAPTEAGTYYLSVKFYENSTTTDVALQEKRVPIDVIDPIVLSFTLSNSSDSDIQLTVYFKINGEKVTDEKGTQTVTVSANSTKVVSYNYFTKSVSDTRYMLCCDDMILSGSIEGLNAEKTFYSGQTDYTWVTVLAVISLVVLVLLFFWVYRKPVVNKGKPKGRR